MHQKQKPKTKRKYLVPELHGEEEKERSDIKVTKTWGGTERPLLLITHKGLGNRNC